MFNRRIVWWNSSLEVEANAKFKEMLKHKLMEYIQEQSYLVAELPSCVEVHRDMQSVTHNVPYFIQSEPSFILTSSQSIANEIKMTYANNIPMLKEGFQLLHNKVSEILAFIITALDRKLSTTIPTHMPAAYGLKGSVLSIPTMRKPMQYVRKEYKEEGVKVLTEYYDGQWAMMITKDSKGHPLSHLQVMKKIWLKEKKETKLALLQFLDVESCI